MFILIASVIYISLIITIFSILYFKYLVFTIYYKDLISSTHIHNANYTCLFKVNLTISTNRYSQRFVTSLTELKLNTNQ